MVRRLLTYSMVLVVLGVAQTTRADVSENSSDSTVEGDSEPAGSSAAPSSKGERSSGETRSRAGDRQPPVVRIGGEVAGGAVSGAAAGFAVLFPLWQLTLARAEGIVETGVSTFLFTLGAGFHASVFHPAAVGAGVWGMGKLAGGEGEFAAAAAGAYIGVTLLVIPLGASTSFGGPQFLLDQSPATIAGVSLALPLVGSVIGYEISHDVRRNEQPEREAGAFDAAGVEWFPVAGVEPEGNWRVGVGGRF